MRGWLAVMLVVACGDDAPRAIGTAESAPASPVVPHITTNAEAPPKPALPVRAPAWTFAVLSDLHLPNPRSALVDQTIAALVAIKVRFVVITGDSTNGTPLPAKPGDLGKWYQAITKTLQPLRDAGIAVFPVAGNHDAYLPAQREAYAKAFDLAIWAPQKGKPFTVHSTGKGLASAPFSYSVDVDNVHLVLGHVVATKLVPEVAAFLASDLEGSTAKHMIAFGHVPLSSVIWSPSRAFVDQLGGILERGHVELYIAGHEHVVWDEDVALPKGGKLRQVLVGCSSGFYDYAPSIPSKQRANCVPIQSPGKREPMRCTMPNGGTFEIARGRKNRHIQHYKQSFTVVTVDGDTISVKPMTVEDTGKPRPFYLDDK